MRNGSATPVVVAAGEPGANGEQGLLSVAFPSDYADSGRLVAFTNNGGDIEVDEFLRAPATPPERSVSRRQVIAIPHTSTATTARANVRSFRAKLSTGQAQGDAPVGIVAPQLELR